MRKVIDRFKNGIFEKRIVKIAQNFDVQYAWLG